MFGRALIVLDGRHPADALERLGARLVAPGGGKLVFHAAMPPVPGGVRDDAGGRRWHARSVFAAAPDTVASVLQAAAAQRCAAIVVSDASGSRWSRLLRRGVAQRLVAASPVPVMVCPPGDSGEVVPGEGFRRLLVALGDGRCARAVIRLGLALARWWSAELVFAQVQPTSFLPTIEPAGVVAGLAPGWVANEEARVSRVLAGAVSQAGRAGLRATGLCLPAGTPQRMLPRLASAMDCDLVVAVRHAGQAPSAGQFDGAALPVLHCVVEGDAMHTGDVWLP